MDRPIKKRTPEGALPALSLQEMSEEDIAELINERDKLKRRVKYLTNSYECEENHHLVHYEELKKAKNLTTAYKEKKCKDANKITNKKIKTMNAENQILISEKAANDIFVTEAKTARTKKSTNGGPLWAFMFGQSGKDGTICKYCNQIIAHHYKISRVVTHIQKQCEYLSDNNNRFLQQNLLNMHRGRNWKNVKK